MKRFRTAVVLFIVLLSLGGLATWDEWKSRREDDDKKNTNRLISAKLDDVVEVFYSTVGLTAENEDGDSTDTAKSLEATLVRKDAQWHLTSPVSAPAEAGSVENLIKTVLDYTYVKAVAESRAQWKEFGLERPSRSIRLKFKESSGVPELTVFIGDKAPVGYNVYIRTDKSDTVYLGSQYFLTSTSKSLFDLRDKSLVKLDEASIKSLDYTRIGQETISLSKADGSYRIVRPVELDADSAATRDFVEHLALAKVVGFVDSVSNELMKAFEQPEVSVTWVDQSGQSNKLSFVQQSGKLFSVVDQNRGPVFELPEDFKTKINKELIDFRNRRILTMDVTDVHQIDIDGMKYVNSAGDWFPADSVGKVGAKESTHIRAFLVDLEFAKTDRFHTIEEVAQQLSKAPENKILIEFKRSGAQPVTLELYATEDAPDKFLVKRSGVPVIYRVPKSVFNSMRPSASRLDGVGGSKTVDQPGNFDGETDLGLDSEEMDVPNG